MGKKKVPYTQAGAGKLPDDKPVVYDILTEGGNINYTGTAKRGRVQERIKEHLEQGDDYVPGASVRIEQMDSIADARAKEKVRIKRNQPKYNDQGK